MTWHLEVMIQDIRGLKEGRYEHVLCHAAHVEPVQRRRMGNSLVALPMSLPHD